MSAIANAREYETDDGYVVLSTQASDGEWWHTVLYHYKHTWPVRGHTVIHVWTTEGGYPTQTLLENILEFAATQLPAAIERQVT